MYLAEESLDFILYNFSKGGYTIMDLSNLKANYTKLTSYMEDRGYSKIYIHSVKAEIDRIILHEKDNSWGTYLDVYRDYKSSSLSKHSLTYKATLVGLIANFDLKGLYPDGRRRHTLWSRGVYAQLLPEFKELVDYYKNTSDILKISENTLKGNVSAISSLLYTLQGMGCSYLTEISEKYVLKFFSADNKNPSISAGYKNTISKILRSCSGYSEDCLRIVSFLPPIHNKRKNVQYITADEVDSLRTIADNSLITLRDKAILFLLLYTGIRACDIAELTFDSVDWKTGMIYIIQQKTAVPLELPLSSLVGNALFDYISEERPDNRNRHIFLSKRRPHFPISSNGLCSAINGIMNKAGIRQKPDDLKGTRIFRHNVATSMLEKGVPIPVISQILGHTAPDSIDSYLHADFVHLKECSISIEKYPVNEEVFVL